MQHIFQHKLKFPFRKTANPTEVIKTEKKKAAKCVALPQFV